MKRLILLLALANILSGCFAAHLKEEHREARELPINLITFSEVEDGVFTGYYSGGKYGWRESRVEVTVENGKVTKIDLKNKVTEKEKQITGTLFERVISKQSLDVDAVTGATLTSRAHLKAIELALEEKKK